MNSETEKKENILKVEKGVKMVQVIETNLFKSKANFMVHQVNCQGAMDFGVAAQVAKQFPHVETEYQKYLRYCKKNNIKALGTIQLVPVDNWAMIMVDTIKNNQVEVYDTNYQYIVNLFSQKEIGNRLQTDMEAVKSGLNRLRKLIETIEPIPSVAISCVNGSNINEMIEQVFGNNKINVFICKCNKEKENYKK